MARGLTLGTYGELLYSLPAPTAPLANTTTRTLISGSTSTQPAFKLPANFFPPGFGGSGQAVYVVAAGVYSTTGTPTLTVAAALDTTQGTFGTALAATGAYTTESGAANFGWQLAFYATSSAAGTSGTLNSNGTFAHGAGGNAATAAAAQLMVGSSSAITVNTLVDNYLEIWATWGAASPSNTITLQQLLVFGEN